MKIRCLDKGIPFQHVLIRVEGDGTCFTYSSLETVLLMQHFQDLLVSKEGRVVPEAIAVKRAVLAKLSRSAMELTTSGEVLFIDHFKNHHMYDGRRAYADAYPGPFTELDSVSQAEVLHDFKYDCYSNQSIEAFNSELVSTVMATEMCVTSHQLGNLLGSWQEYNQGSMLMNTYQCNIGGHYWGFLEADEVKQTKIYSSVELAQLKRMESFVLKKHTEEVPLVKKLKRVGNRRFSELVKKFAWFQSLELDAKRAVRNWKRYLLMSAMLPIFPGFITDTSAEKTDEKPSRGKCVEALVEVVRRGMFGGTEMNAILKCVGEFWDKKISVEEMEKLNKLCNVK
jgi:hypothetical protein